MGSARLRDEAGLDWLIMVAVPRHDFIHRIEDNFVRTGLLGLAVALVVGLIGLAVLAAVARELRRFAVAAGQVGRGEPGVLLPTDRRDELGDLARSFVDMQSRLMTDPLTGLSNREAVMRRIEERILQQRRRGDSRPFVVMFVDFNRFKQINDRFGHDVGDADTPCVSICRTRCASPCWLCKPTRRTSPAPVPALAWRCSPKTGKTCRR